MVNSDTFIESHPFPSPCGEKVGINFLGRLVIHCLIKESFPSPCGEKVGINRKPCSNPSSADTTVSVPLRGKGRDQLDYDVVTHRSHRVSVPLRGKGRDQHIVVNFFIPVTK